MVEAALAPSPTKSVQLERIPFGADVADVMAIIRRDGAVILTQALTRDQVDAVNREIEPQFGAVPQGNFGAGEETALPDSSLQDFMGRQTKRLVHCLKYSRTYREAIVGNSTLA